MNKFKLLETFSAFKAEFAKASNAEQNEILEKILDLVGGYWVSDRTAYVHPIDDSEDEITE